MRRNPWAVALVTILTAGGLGLAGWGVYQAGYRAGLLETANEVVVHGPGYGWGFFPGFGIFFGFLFLFFLFGIIGRFFFWRGWRGGSYRNWNEEEGSPMEKRLGEWHDKAHRTGRTYRSDQNDTA